MIPELIKQDISNKLNTRIINFFPVSGGCISNGGKLETTEGYFFLKWNSASRYPRMFDAEEKGLNLLRKTRTISLPEVVITSEIDDWQFIVMEMFDSGDSSKNVWEELGTKIALLHKHSHPNFGLDHDNYIGSLIQKNTFTKSWNDFFVNYRLAPQLKMLRDSNNVDISFVTNLEFIYPKLGELLPAEPPALLHGDLWSGNVIMGKIGPHVIDPAVYYGHREAEIAFTKLFGGFENSFYNAYEQEYPMLSKFEQRIDLYNLYPLLVHANLFGQSYVSSIRSILKKYA